LIFLDFSKTLSFALSSNCNDVSINATLFK